MTFNGTTLTVAALTESSARKYKKNIESLQDSLAKVTQLQGISFIRKDQERKELGFIAEEVMQVFPELVEYDANGEVDSVFYQRLVAVLVEAIKELNERVNKLEGK